MTTAKIKATPGVFLLDIYKPSREHAEKAYLIEESSRTWILPLIIGAFFLLVSVIGWITNPHQFYFAYLTAWSFCLSISLGALFFVMVHHITRARWPIVLRRIPEMLAWSFPMLAILSIPVIAGMHDLYHWTHDDLYVEGGPGFDEILAGKRSYLNTPFFLIRLVLYFLLWSYLSYRLYSLSLQQDITADPDIIIKQRKVSGWGIPLFAVTVAFASYDLLMSLDPHWFSTIFGVYIFSGAFWVAIGFVTLAAAGMQRYGSGALDGVVTNEHYHDLGKWMFAFTVFWAYIAFSQYMLIWYGNIPEEIIWYKHRSEHGWGLFSMILLFAHFVIPFIVLLPRQTKRSVTVLIVMGIWILFFHWFDLFWVVMPVAREHAGFHWLDFTCLFGLLGIYTSAFLFRSVRHSLVPRHDPYLGASLRFENV